MKVYQSEFLTVYEHNGLYYGFDGKDTRQEIRQTAKEIYKDPNCYCESHTLAEAAEGYDVLKLKVLHESLPL